VPPRIAVTRRIPEPGLELLRGAGEVWLSPHDRPLTRQELLKAVAGADALVTLLHDRIDGEVLDAAGPQLRVVGNMAVGYDNVDVAAATERGVVVTNTPGVLTDATADLAVALMLAVTRRLGEAERLVRSGHRWSWDMFFMLGSGLSGKTLGVVGLGGIGRAVAERALAFGLQIVYAGPRRAPAEVESALGGARRLPLEDLLRDSDLVTLHCPLTPETRHLIDADALALMRPSAYLVNTARGPVVDESALVEALRSGALAGAGLDVYEDEPEVHPGLLELENVVLLPHLGSATVETRSAMAKLAAENAIAVLDGRAPTTPINPEVL
jgi:lactate dehydrogenase-like 2-hydroxyacid dehydrogenase